MKPLATGNRAELIERALDLFAAYGYDGVGVQDVCEAAAVTKPTLYHYFRSKRGLLDTLMQERIDGLIAPLAELASAAGEAPNTLRLAACATMAFARENPSFYRLYLALWFAPLRSEGHDVAASYHARHFAAMQAVCAVLTRERPESKAAERALTAAFLGAINNAIGLALNNYGALNERAAAGLVDQFLYGVLRPAGARTRKGR